LWSKENDLMPQLVEPSQHECQNANNAINLWQKCFGEDCNPQRSTFAIFHNTSLYASARNEPPSTAVIEQLIRMTQKNPIESRPTPTILAQSDDHQDFNRGSYVFISISYDGS